MPQTLIVGFLVATLVAVCAFHLYWIAGGRRLSDYVIPTRREDGSKLFHPSRLGTMLAATYLALVAGLALAVYQELELRLSLAASRILLMGAGAIFVLRAIGDFHYIGFSKRVRGTKFSRIDDRLFSPLVLALGIASLALALT